MFKLLTSPYVFVSDSGEGFKCDRCGKVFAYMYYRDKHLKYTRCVDQGDRKFPCHLCNRSFEKRDRLRIHILHVHEKHRPHKVNISSSVWFIEDFNERTAMVLKEQLPFRKAAQIRSLKVKTLKHCNLLIFSYSTYFKWFDTFVFICLYKSMYNEMEAFYILERLFMYLFFIYF